MRPTGTEVHQNDMIGLRIRFVLKQGVIYLIVHPTTDR